MSEQSVTYMDLRFHTPAEQKRKRRPKHTRDTEFSEQEVTYSHLKFHIPSEQQKQQTSTSAESTDYPTPTSSWLVTVILGLLCMALLVTAGVLGAKFLQLSHRVRRQNEELIEKQAILGNFTQLQETLKNCTNQRDDLQAQKANFSKVVSRKGEKCSLCSEGWIEHGGKCYHFSEERRTWKKSQEYCSSHNSRLLVIKNKEELDFINRLVCFHWIGLSRGGAATAMKWEDGTAHSTDLFQVKKETPGESCVALNAEGGAIRKCAEEFRYICEKKPS
ncbi:natural killer cells antigen CD94-like [Carettochelys insculpta]|uniref:natural killer cells antigen CD94-like n=1 Tax=Carettochelys insculpta TaxID=44489 RepID=UPI003EBD24DC